MNHQPTRNYARDGAAALLAAGCIYVLKPFLAAVLCAGAVVITTWPLYLRLRRAMGGRSTMAALTMTFSLALLVIIPLALVAYHLVGSVGATFDQLRTAVARGALVPPTWVRGLPLVGEQADAYLRGVLASREQMVSLAQRLMEPTRAYLLSGGIMLGTGVAQMSLAVFVSFFLYRDGTALATAIGTGMQKILRSEAQAVTETVAGTVRGVMYGLLGTALAQALVAAIGFAIAGAPAIALLSGLVFASSLIPIGPSVVWGTVSLWLFAQGSTGAGIFMLVWGVLLISGIDNVVRPVLISRGCSLTFLPTLLGVLGGVFAFGVVGIFIGPTLLAAGSTMLAGWIGTRPEP